MKKEARLLAIKAVNSLTLSVEFFNRPSDRGRVEAVLILLDHAFEMLLKAAILHKGGRIRENQAKNTIGFDQCVRKGLSEGPIRFLIDEQALTLQSINSLRDAAQHHLLDISEQHLYMQAQAGLTLFRDIYENVFDRSVALDLPERVLPLSTKPPCDLATLFDSEIGVIRELLSPRKRRKIEATTKIRALAILDKSLQGETVQPTEKELLKIASQLNDGKDWKRIFPGVAAVEMTATGSGPSIDLRIVKKDSAVPVHIVPEGTPGSSVVAIKRVDELGYFNLGRNQLAEKVGLSGHQTSAIIWKLSLKKDSQSYKLVEVGNSKFHRYSQNAITKIKDFLDTSSLDNICNEYNIYLGHKRSANRSKKGKSRHQ